MATAVATTEEHPNYLTHETGWKSWAFTLDHKRIGLMYLIAVLLSFLAGGIFALLVRAELAFRGESFLVGDGTIGPVSQKLYDTITGIQAGTLPDPYGWVRIVR